MPRQPKAEQRVGHILMDAIHTMLGSVGMTYPTGTDLPKLWAHPIPFWTGGPCLPIGSVALTCSW